RGSSSSSAAAPASAASASLVSVAARSAAASAPSRRTCARSRARPRRRVALGAVMAQQIFLGPDLGEAARGGFGLLPRCPPFLPGSGERGQGARMLGGIVEQRAVRRRVEQAALLALA